MLAAVLRRGARVRGQAAATPRRRAAPGRRPSRRSTADRVVLGDGTSDPDPPGGLGRRRDGRAARRRSRGLPQGRGGRIDVHPDLSVSPASPPSTRSATSPTFPTGDGASRCRSSAASPSRPASWAGGQHHRRPRGKRAAAVPLPGQGHHGDDRPQGRGRRDRRAPARAGRPASRSRPGSACTPSCSPTRARRCSAFIAWAEEFYLRPAHRSARAARPVDRRHAAHRLERPRRRGTERGRHMARDPTARRRVPRTSWSSSASPATWPR